MSAKRLLDLIEHAGLLDSALLRDLRRQISEQNASAAAVAKHLVDKGHLTRFQATKFVRDAGERPSAEPGNEPPEKVVEPDDEELTLAPFDDVEEEERIRIIAAAAAAARRNADDVILLEDAGDALKPVEDAGSGLTPVGTPAGLSPLEESSLDSLLPDDEEDFDHLAEPPVVVPPKIRRSVSAWESKLMLGGGFALALLLILFAVLFVNLSKAPAVEMWDAAMESYRSESYSQAQAAFEEYLEDYPEEEHASEARVRIALCKIRNVLRDPHEVLLRSQQLLPVIESSEPAFSLAREELATILLQIPQGFVRAAKNTAEQKEKVELVALAEDGLELVNNPSYVPSSRRNSIQTELTRVIEDVNLIHRDINRDNDLTASMEAIDAAGAAGQTADAYETYQQLIRKYPGLENSPLLTEAVKRVASYEQKLVATTTEIYPAQTEYREPAFKQIVLATRTGDSSSSTEGVSVVRVNAAVYGIRNSDGGVVWRQSVGEMSPSSVHPVDRDPDADVLFVDAQNQAVVRASPQNGQLTWRLEVGEPLFAPLVMERAIFVTTELGKILRLDPTSGRSEEQLVLPQGVTTAVVGAVNHGLILQVGQHSNIYALNAERFKCDSVYYLGHKPGGVIVPPLVHFGHAFVAENAGVDYSLLHVLAIKDDGGQATLTAAQEPIRLRGNVIVPIVRYGRRILVATDQGGIEVFDVDMNKRPPVSSAASLAATRTEPLTAFAAAAGGSLWVVDDRLSQYRVQVTTKEITREAITYIGDTFVAQPLITGDQMVHVRHPKAAAGIAISASSLDDIRQNRWEARLEVPITTLSVNAEQQISAVTAAGTLFEIAAQRFTEGGVLQLVDESGPRGHFSEAVALPNGETVLFDPMNYQRAVVFEPGDGRGLRNIRLDLGDSRVTAPPVPFGNAILLALGSGDVAALALANGKPIGKPFQPQLAAGESIVWRRPAVLSETEFVIADDRREIYRVALKQDPAPHLELAHSATLTLDLVSTLATLGDTIYAVARSASSDSIVALSPQGLEPVEQIDLGDSRVTWGPETSGDVVLFVTDHSELHCYAAPTEARWKTTAAKLGQPVGLPLAAADMLVFALQRGAVCWVSMDTGEVIGQVELDQRLSAGPVAFRDQFLVAGEDGALIAISLPGGP